MEKRTAEEILAELDEALRGQADVSPFDPIADLVEDVLDSMALALSSRGVGRELIEQSLAEAISYLEFHYL